jgi:hypothetical protein
MMQSPLGLHVLSREVARGMGFREAYPFSTPGNVNVFAVE